MRNLEKHEQIERSIITDFRKDIWNPFIKAIKQYELIQANDKIAVCISGGKDSMLCAKLIQMLQRHSETPFEIVFLVMDPGYSQENRERIESNAKLLNIPIDIFESDIYNVVSEIDKSPCYLCARMRRGYLYANAKERGCNKIALGHHMSDVIETTLMGMLYGAQIQAMLPRIKSTNFEGMELIRPMYCILEESVLAWKKQNDLHFIQCACRFTENCSTCQNEDEDEDNISKRLETKMLIKKLKQKNPMIEQNIFNSIHNVNVDTLVNYKLGNKKYSFLDKFNK